MWLRGTSYEHPIDIGDCARPVEHPFRVSISLPHPSNRLVRAAAAEHEGLTRHRERLLEQRKALIAEVRHMDEALAEADDRLRVLAQLAGQQKEPLTLQRGVAHDGDAARLVDVRADGSVETLSPEPRRLLRGPAVREVAVHVLLAQPSRIEAIHYRHWYELVTAAGYAVAGKDPRAVFLTQVTRSPVVRKATQPGVYEIDRGAATRIRARLQKLQFEFREANVDHMSPADLSVVRARRHEFDVAISREERALDEALRVLRTERSGHPASMDGNAVA
jgi:hypothetical protein